MFDIDKEAKELEEKTNRALHVEVLRDIQNLEDTLDSRKSHILRMRKEIDMANSLGMGNIEYIKGVKQVLDEQERGYNFEEDELKLKLKIAEMLTAK